MSVMSALMLQGCAETAQGPLAGASDAWQSGTDRVAVARSPQPAPVWDLYREALRWPAANPSPFTSRGHQPEQSVEVRANELARASYASLVSDTVFPNGSVLVELPQGNGHGYAMQKAKGAWAYFELDSKGRALESGALTFCGSCHAQAPADSVFGSARVP